MEKLIALMGQTSHIDRLRTKVTDRLVEALEQARERIKDLQDSLRLAQRAAERRPASAVPTSPQTKSSPSSAFLALSADGMGDGERVKSTTPPS